MVELLSPLSGLLAVVQEAAADSVAAPTAFNLRSFVAAQGVGPLVRAALLLLLGLPAAWLLARWVRSYVTGLGKPQKGLVAAKVIFWPLVVVILVSVLRELGFSLGPLLGAAGILGIALGFASQTSVSNIISGFFLLAEEPFQVGDVIDVDGIVGQVLTIDTLSVKIRTFDNKMVRIPNETLVKSRFTNITRFPIRRVDIPVGVAYREDIGRVREVLVEIAEDNPLVLMEPEPLVIFDGYADSAINFKFAVWAKRENFLDVRNTITEDLKVRFDQEGIEIPFPHRSLYTGSVTEPFPIRIVREGEEPSPERTEDTQT